MSIPEELKAVPGARELHDWFGYWPVFLDAEIVSVHLERRAPCVVAVHTYEMTDRTDDIGYYIRQKDVIVEFVLEDVSELHLTSFTTPNIVSSLACRKTARGYRLHLDAYYGLGGTIDARAVSIRLRPGKPTD